MAELSKGNIPDFQTLMFPIMEFLRDNKTHTLQEVLDFLIAKFNITDEDLRIYVPSGQQQLFKNRVTWAISYLKNAGLIAYVKRAVYQITEIGQTIFNDNISFITSSYLKKFSGFKFWQETWSQSDEMIKADVGMPEVNTPEEIIGKNIKKINDELSAEFIDIVKQITPAQFEEFVLRL